MKPKIRINTRDMEIVSQVYQNPHKTYGEIGKQFGLSAGRISKIVSDVRRQAIVKPTILAIGGVSYFTPGAPLPDLTSPIVLEIPTLRKD